MSKVEISDRFAAMWKQARTDAGKSQAWLAKAMMVSKTTIQNWENGIGCPNQKQGFEVFSALGLNPLPYYLRVLFPDDYVNGTNDEMNSALNRWAESQSPADKEKLYFWTYGDHGSSPKGVLELIVAYLHLPLINRVFIAHDIYTNYKLQHALGNTCNDDYIQPDMELLTKALNKGTEAVYAGEDKYTIIDDGQNISV